MLWFAGPALGYGWRFGGHPRIVAFRIDWIDAAGDYMCIHAGGRTHIPHCTHELKLSRTYRDKVEYFLNGPRLNRAARRWSRNAEFLRSDASRDAATLHSDAQCAGAPR